MIGDQKRAQSTSSNRLAAIDPKSQYAVQPNNKSWDDISWQTLHLFLKIKVLRRSVEATAQSGHSLHLARMSAIGDKATLLPHCCRCLFLKPLEIPLHAPHPSKNVDFAYFAASFEEILPS
ncbi:MAG: hypothetical protein ACI92A_000003 [Candidatus Paceibacteria bacterium]|jgi:hypothetical protein